jgi:ABC-2 type transport system ATP-binding protein
MILLKAENLKKRYKKVQAVDGVSFHIEKGEVFGLLGENGAGKTTVIKMLATLTRPDSGHAEIMGTDIFQNAHHARKKIAIVPQEINLDGELSVRDNLYIYAKLHHIPDACKKISETAEIFGLTDKLKEKVSGLSGGQKRRVMLARVMTGEPELIFMDEPTIGLDPSIRKDIWNMIRNIKEAGKSVLLTTHYTEEAELLCSRVALMQKGKLVKTGTPDALVKQTGELAADMVAGSVQMTRIFADANELDCFLSENRISSYNVRQPRLEDVIIDLKRQSI